MSLAAKQFAALAPPTDDTLNNHDLVAHGGDPTHPCNLIADLCRGFYTLGWVTSVHGSRPPASHLPHALAG